MARTNIEGDTFERLSVFAQMLRWSEREALGLLAILWHDSQAYKQEFVTEEDLIHCARLYGDPEEEQKLILKALLKFQFLEDAGEGKYKIRGNKKQIAVIASYEERTKKATEARLAKLRGAKRAPEETEDDTPPPDAPPPEENNVNENVNVTSTSHECDNEENVNVTQGNAKQGNAKQLSGRGGPPDPPPPPPGKLVYKTAEEFRASFPIATIEEATKEFGDKHFEQMVEECFEFHNLDKKAIPTTAGAWAKRWFTWVRIERGKQLRSPTSKRPFERSPERKWENAAGFILDGIYRHQTECPGDPEGLRELIGDRYFQLMLKIGGTERFLNIRTTPELRALGSELKEAHEALEREGPSPGNTS